MGLTPRQWCRSRGALLHDDKPANTVPEGWRPAERTEDVQNRTGRQANRTRRLQPGNGTCASTRPVYCDFQRFKISPAYSLRLSRIAAVEKPTWLPRLYGPAPGAGVEAHRRVPNRLDAIRQMGKGRRSENVCFLQSAK